METSGRFKSRLVVALENGIKLRASYRTLSPYEVEVTMEMSHDKEGLLHRLRRRIAHQDGNLAVHDALYDLKAKLLASDINTFTIDPTLDRVKWLMQDIAERYRAERVVE